MNLVDTDVLIDFQRGHPPARAWFSSLTQMPAVPGFVVMELIQNSQNGQHVRQSLQLVAPLKVVWPTEQHCVQAIANFAVYHLSHRLGIVDCLNAATAISLSATLFTFNGKHYRAIPGLMIAEPYVR